MELVRRDYFHILDVARASRHAPSHLEGEYALRSQQEPRERPDNLAAVDTPDGKGDEVWLQHVEREVTRFQEGALRLAGADGPNLARRRDQQLMRIASAAWGAGLALLMLSRNQAARSWLLLSALCYRRSLADAEPGSWGRSIGALKARLIVRDLVGALQEADWTLDLRSEPEPSTIGNYAACIAYLTHNENDLALERALELSKDSSFPPATAEACRALATFNASAYERSIKEVLRTFEERSRFLEDIPVADTVLALQVLAEQRDLALRLESPRLPESPAS